ncbi:MAG: cobalt chelatase [Burkholderiaceae bacterium]
MNEAQARARHQQQVEELCAASIRALAGESDLHFRARRLHRGRTLLPLYAPHLHPSLEIDDFGSFRGAADGLALRLAHSDATVHQHLAPLASAEPIARLVFDLLEQFRVEACVPPGLPGVVRNLRHRFEAWSLGFHHAGHTETVRGLLLYTAAQVCRSRVTGEPVVEATEDRIETTRGKLVPLIGHALAHLRRARTDQAAYAVHALAIARSVAALIDADDDTDDLASVDADPDDPRSIFAILTEPIGETLEPFAAAASGRSKVLDAAGGTYRVFTTVYDRELTAVTLARPALLAEYRARIDQRIAGQGVNGPKLARELRALLAQPAIEGWDDAQEEGRIDGRRLAQLIASPTERRLFRTERVEPRADCIVSFLIDCSGSMKEHSESLAMVVDVFARALEQAGVASEILGFTTGAWNGGRAQRDWRRAGRPAHPGRLNERCHLVFKDAATKWRRARPGVAALLKHDLFREGIDGEAIEWACARLLARAEERKLLLVVSDGSPMDTATHLANDAHYLDHHLRDVVARIEQARQVQISGVGVGLDLSPYYSRSHVLDLAGSTGNTVFRELIELIGGRRRR